MVCATDERMVETMTDLPTLADNLPLPDGYRTEIIDGSLVVSPTPSYRHARIIRLCERILDRDGPEGLEALQWVTVEVSQDGDRFVPDLAVLPTAVVDGEGWEGPDWLRSAEDLELAVEVVSPSSALHDWKAKTKGYARAGVPLYLVIDPRKSEIALFSEPEGGKYQTVERAVPGASVHLGAPFDLDIQAAGLLQ